MFLNTELLNQRLYESSRLIKKKKISTHCCKVFNQLRTDDERLFCQSVPDLPFCLSVLQHRTPLAREGLVVPSSYQKMFSDGFLLMSCYFFFTTTGNWAAMNVCVSGIDLTYFYDLSIRF